MERNNTLDVIKGLCIILVIVTHCNWESSARLSLLFPFWIDMAVPIFMVISGYVTSLSMQRHSVDTLPHAYSRKNVLPKLIRYTVPFLMAFTAEYILFFIKAIILNENYSFSITSLITSLLQGGVGPGSYYYPILVQLIFLFPILYFIIMKYDFRGLIICLILNIIYEVLKSTFLMSEECYRLLVFRYIFVISAGCYLLIGKSPVRKILLLVSFALGVLFISACSYFNYQPKILYYWTGTSFLSCLYILPIIAIIIKKVHLNCTFLIKLGKASYDIFLTQMVYYATVANFLCRYVKSFPFQIILNIIICITLGLLLHRIEQPITTFVNKRLIR